MYVMHRGGGIPPELPDSQVTSLFVRFSLIGTLDNLFFSLGTEIHVTGLLCGTKGGCGGAKKIACVFERSDWMFFSLFWPMRFARARTM